MNENEFEYTDNGLALFFHEDTGKLQLIEMKKIRTVHKEQSRIGMTPGTSSEHHTLEGFHTSIKDSSSYLHEKNISQAKEKSIEGVKKIRTVHEEQSALASPPERIPKGTKQSESHTSEPLNLSEKNISQQNSTVNENLASLVYEHAEIEVNGIKRDCKTGLLDGFKNAVTRLEERNETIGKMDQCIKNLVNENNVLKNENTELKEKLSSIQEEKKLSNQKSIGFGF